MFLGFAVTVAVSLLFIGVAIFQFLYTEYFVILHLVIAPLRNTKKLPRQSDEKMGTGCFKFKLNTVGELGKT